jgi:ABC-2 type transport system permease protein
MEIKKPTLRQGLISLLRADFTVQLRQSRSPLMATLLAIVILISWKNLAKNYTLGLLASCIIIVLLGMGLLGYPGTISRDRDKGVFQRLRVTPVPVWTIMASRLVVQLAIIAFTTVVVLLFARFINHISLNFKEYILTIMASVLCGGLFLGIGQFMAGLIKSAETLNSAGRFIYFPLAFGGALAEMNILGNTTRNIIQWSPYGTVQTVLLAAMGSTGPYGHLFAALLLTAGYAILFISAGIFYFKWNN